MERVESATLGFTSLMKPLNRELRVPLFCCSQPFPSLPLLSFPSFCAEHSPSRLFHPSKVLRVLGLIVAFCQQCQTSAGLERLNVTIRVRADARWRSDCWPQREQFGELSVGLYTPSTCSSARSHTKTAVPKTEQIPFHLPDGLICSEVYVSQ